MLSISTATGRNWIKLGKLIPEYTDQKKPYFTKSVCRKAESRTSIRKEPISEKQAQQKIYLWQFPLQCLCFWKLSEHWTVAADSPNCNRRIHCTFIRCDSISHCWLCLTFACPKIWSFFQTRKSVAEQIFKKRNHPGSIRRTDLCFDCWFWTSTAFLWKIFSTFWFWLCIRTCWRYPWTHLHFL